MAHIHIKVPLIETLIENKRVYPELPRPYLGLSMLGHECPRYLWYYLHWAFMRTVSPRMKRIFERGDLEEARVIRDLRDANCYVQSQQDALEFIDNYSKGHCDGVVNIPSEGLHVLEIKTMKQSDFTKLRKSNIEAAKPVYYAQAMLYMHILKLEKALFVVTNKDTEERYYEVINYDETISNFLLSRAIDIIKSEIPPARINDNPSWFACKFCDAIEVCHYGKQPERNCRTCEHVKKLDNWTCSKTDHELTIDEQKAGCDLYAIAPNLSATSDQ